MIIDFEAVWRESMDILPAGMDSVKAKAEIIAIGLQESRFEHRRQMNNGPAMGFWQFEQGGGVRGVLNHAQTKRIATALCARFNIEASVIPTWSALEHNDVLACCFARLLLLTAPWPLPGPDDPDEGWRQYEWCWRPGKPHPEFWPENFSRAWQMVDA